METEKDLEREKGRGRVRRACTRGGGGEGVRRMCTRVYRVALSVAQKADTRTVSTLARVERSVLGTNR